jgi:hypothetical protein
MKQALEALEKDSPWREETIGKLRAAIEQAEKQEPHTEWLVCPNCNHKSPYSPIKAKTNEEDAERITKQARAALEREKQQPVAWMTIDAYGEEDDIHYEDPKGNLPEGWTCMPLYTAPPQRQPLTEEEIDEIWRTYLSRDERTRAIERKHGITGDSK